MAEDNKKFGVVTSNEAEKRKAAEAAAKAAADKAAQEKLLAERAAAAKLAEFEAGRKVGIEQGVAIGMHKQGAKNFWHGAFAAFVCLSIGATFTYLIQGANREQNMIESRVAVGAAISNAKLLNESEAMKAPVVEPDPVK